MIETYKITWIVDGASFESETDAYSVSNFVVSDMLEDINLDGVPDWREISRQPMIDIKSQIVPSARLQRGTHFTGWLSFYSNDFLRWPIDESRAFSLILTDSYGQEFSRELECPPYNPERIIERIKPEKSN